MGSSPPASSLPASQHYGTSRHNSAQFFFQPPKSPAVVATTPSLATATDRSSAGSRKRQRPSSIDDTRTLPGTWTETPAWAQYSTPSDNLHGSDYASADLINEKYDLAGGFDTPSLRSTSGIDRLTVNDNEFRRRLRDDDMDFGVHSGCTPVSGPLARERNGTARLRSYPNEQTQATWTSLAVGIVGKVFSFGSNVVRGFYAGGGRGYDLQNSALVGSDLLEHSKERSATPIPGAWQDGTEFLGDFEQDSPSFAHASASRPAAKRRQTERDTWVIVDTPDQDGVASSPRRKASSNSVPRSSLASTKSAASRAPSRRSLAPVSRRQGSFANFGSPAPLQQCPVQTHSRRASLAQTRSPQARPSSGGSGAGYMSPEAERFAKRQARQDLKADKTMANMGNRIQEMMRQAQEALGTKYSVEGGTGQEDDLDDEGFVDDEW